MSKKRFVVTAVLAAFSAANAAAGPLAMRIFGLIYGVDDRIDLFEASAEMQKAADSTAALFQASKVTVDAAKGTAKLTTEKYGDKQKLAKTERFYDEPSGAFCSGALVGADLVLTAGHCIASSSDCEGTKFVFGYAIKTKGADPSVVPSTEVYACKQVVKTVPEFQPPSSFGDFAKWML